MTTRMVMRCLAHMAIMLLAACGDEQADAAGTPIVDSRVASAGEQAERGALGAPRLGLRPALRVAA